MVIKMELNLFARYGYSLFNQCVGTVPFYWTEYDKVFLYIQSDTVHLALYWLNRVVPGYFAVVWSEQNENY